MVASARSFYVSLWEEHLEEASALLEQIAAYRHDPTLAWSDLADWELRLRRRIDALAFGDDLALSVCRRRLTEGDAGEKQAALRVFCRKRRKDLVYETLERFGSSEAADLEAMAAALKAEAPAEWHAELASLLSRHAALAPVLAPLIGERRLKAETALLAALPSTPEAKAAAVLVALGRIGGEASLECVASFARADEPHVSAAACRAALRLSAGSILEYCLHGVQGRPWLAMPLGLGGGRRAVSVLVSTAGSAQATDETLIALGLLGDLSAIRAIFDCLTRADLAPAAALALQLITGAELQAETFLPDQFSPDELFDEERDCLEATGEWPKRADGQPFGTTVTVPSTDPAVWRGWLSQNKARFDPARRYRYGQPYSVRSLLMSLEAERIPNSVRALICDELRIRYGVDFPLEIDMPVVEQRRLLVRLREWAAINESKFEPGEWYFHGRRID
ncbi:MAG TPA: hypothetical protein VFV10_12580 [Gammaproteobacteria bacterium]|nr:hypothetical protein [Gammaproteobacteria bacterium]